jgi:hypothetical protein
MTQILDSLQTNNFLTVGTFYQDTPTSISAAGTAQGTATLVTRSYVVVTTVTTGSATGVILPVVTPGMKITISNRSGNAATALNVYPTSGTAIDAAGANIAVTIPNGASATYEASTATQWYTTSPILTGGAGTTIAYGNGQATITANAGALTNTYVSSTTVQTSSSTAVTQFTGMTTTPAAGTYYVTFCTTGTAGDSNTDIASYWLQRDASALADTLRQFGSAIANLPRAMVTQTVVTVNGAQVITAQYQETSAAFSFTTNVRSMFLLKVA